MSADVKYARPSKGHTPMAERLEGRPPEEVAWPNDKRSKGALG